MKKLQSFVAFGISASALCVALLTPDWKNTLHANTSGYASLVSHITANTKQSLVVAQCGKEKTVQQIDVKLYDDNSAYITLSDSSLPNLSGSWYVDVKGAITVVLDGENNFVTGSTKSIGTLLDTLEQRVSSTCGTSVVVVDPSVKTSFIIKTNGSKAKVVFKNTGYQTSTTLHKFKHKISGNGVISDI